MIETLKFVKIRCNKCNYITLIPTRGNFGVPRLIHCEDCGKVILKKEQ